MDIVDIDINVTYSCLVRYLRSGDIEMARKYWKILNTYMHEGGTPPNAWSAVIENAVRELVESA